MTSDELRLKNGRRRGTIKRVDTLGLVTRSALGGSLVAAFLLLTACRQDMQVQPRYNPMGASTFFDDGRSERPVVPGTVARGESRADSGYCTGELRDEAFCTGKVNGVEVDAFPFPVTRDVLARGQERFNIYCTPCHGRLGDGQGMIVQRGFPPPPSYHIDRLRQAPVGHFFSVMTDGYGTMYSYASRVPPEDRWAIAAYIRALQLSQDAKLADLEEVDRQHLASAPGADEKPAKGTE